MAMTPTQCIQRLASGEMPRLLMLFGDEPQQKLDVTDTWRKTAKAQQFDERHTFVADSEFDWQQLVTTANTMSLFSEKQVIELNLPTGKPGTSGAAALVEWASTDNPDVALLLHGPSINQSVKNTKWFKTLESQGVVCFCYELKGNQLAQYLSQYARSTELNIANDAITALADMNEGNLLAAKQEIDKLTLTFPAGSHIAFSDIEAALSLHSKYSVFELTEAVLAGDINKAIVILGRLEQEGIEPNIVIWQLINEAQRLEECMHQQQSTGRINFAKMRIWQSKQRFYVSALNRLHQTHIKDILQSLATADIAFKTEKIEQPFVVLAHLCLMFLPADLTQLQLT